MSKTKLNIEIIRSTVRELSSLSHASAIGIRNELSKHYSNVVISIVNNVFDLELIVERNPDLVFTGLKYVPLHTDSKDSDSPRVWATQFLESHGIMCTGSDAESHRLELDKALSKQCVLNANLPTSKFLVVSSSKKYKKITHSLSYPLFVKPIDRGGGLGIDSYSVVNNYEQLISKVNSISIDTNSDSLIESYLSGREFSVAILKNINNDGYLKMSLELIAPLDKNGNRLLSEKVKSDDTESFVYVDDIILKKQIENLALSVFEALGARDYGRIDIRLDNEGNPQFLEANLIPSLLQNYGNFPKACMLNESIDYKNMLMRIVDLAAIRKNVIIDLKTTPTTIVSLREDCIVPSYL